MNIVNAADKKCLACLISYIRDRRTDEPAKIDIYSHLLVTRGKGCGDHALVLIRSYGNQQILDGLEKECTDIFSTHPIINKTTWQVKICISTFCLMLFVILGLIGLAICGYGIPKDQRYLVGLLMGLLVGALVLAGTSTATVDAAIPFRKNIKAVIKLGGTGAGVVGTCLIFHSMGY